MNGVVNVAVVTPFVEAASLLLPFPAPVSNVKPVLVQQLLLVGTLPSNFTGKVCAFVEFQAKQSMPTVNRVKMRFIFLGFDEVIIKLPQKYWMVLEVYPGWITGETGYISFNM